jgi:hypothetical protein
MRFKNSFIFIFILIELLNTQLIDNLVNNHGSLSTPITSHTFAITMYSYHIDLQDRII